MSKRPEPKHLVWRKAHRILAARYPPIHLFERLSSDPDVWDALIALEQKVNPRVRDELGEIALVPKEDRLVGPGASWVMAAFTHVNPKGSRFSDGTYGVYYAGKERETAIRETAYHFARFARDSGDGVRNEDMRVLVSGVRGEFVEVTARQRPLLHRENYTESRAFAVAVRESGASGIVYPSVRNPEGSCIAAFKPKAIVRATEERRLLYHFDGKVVSKYFDYHADRWHTLTW